MLAAVQRYCAEEVVARVHNPAFDNSAMDGYALCSADLTSDQSSLPVQGESSCGDLPKVLAPGTAMRIFTGAPLPQGADCVVIQEDVQREQDRIWVREPLTAGDNIRRQGEDFYAGQPLYQRGHCIRPLDLALLATNGYSAVPVVRQPRALVLATGNELTPPGAALEPGRIYESNRHTAMALLRAQGVAVDDGGIIADDVAALRAVLTGAQAYDFIITSGGASVGDHDLVKQVFAELGTIDLWRIRIKPGKPVVYGHIGARTHFFALPGNPVSSLVTYYLFVRPAITVWQHGVPSDIALHATAVNGFRRQSGRREFLRARLQVVDGKLLATTLAGQGSHMVGPLRHTNGLIIVPEESTGFDPGAVVTVMPLTLDAGMPLADGETH